MQCFATRPIQKSNPPRILIAEPDPDVRATYAYTFATTGSDVIEAADGRDALVKALVRVPSLVVSELHLPLLDGFSLCNILRQDRVTQDVPILIVTADTDRTNFDRVLRAGADQVIAKPAATDLLLLEVRRLQTESVDLRRRSLALRHKVSAQLEHSASLISRSLKHRSMMSHAHQRMSTTNPPHVPPMLKCPTCDANLEYEHSEIGGVNALQPEQWDYFLCKRCGTFQYRQRTRKVKKVS